MSASISLSLVGCGGEPEPKPVVPVDTAHYADVVVLIDGQEVLDDGSITVEVTPETPVEVRFTLVNDQPAPVSIRLEMTQPTEDGDLVVAAPLLKPASEGETGKFTGTMQASNFGGKVEMTLVANAPTGEETLIYRAPVQVRSPD